MEYKALFDLQPTADCDRRRRRLLLGLVALASLAACAYLLLWTVGTQPIVGDEARHFRRTFNYFEAPWPELRVAIDPALPSSGPGAIHYFDTSLWHTGLALVWKALSHVSLLAAQLYHTAFLLVLAIFTYLIGRHFYGHRGGLWAWALLLTVPMNLLFGMTFYMEIPVMAFTAMAVYLLMRNRPVLLGLCLAGMFLTKNTSATVLGGPLLLAALLTMGQTWRQRLLRTGLAAAVMALVVAPDLWWHWQHFGRPVLFRFTDSCFYPDPLFDALLSTPAPIQTGVTASIFNPVMTVMMLGLPGLVFMLLGLWLAIRGLLSGAWESVRQARHAGWRATLATLPDHFQPADFVLGLPIVIFVAAYILMLRRAYDVRYLQPLTLFAAVYAAGLLVRLESLRHGNPALASGKGLGVRVWAFLGRPRRKWLIAPLLALLVLAMIGQALTVPWKVRQLRTLEPQVAEAFQWIAANTAPNDRILYLEESLTAMTGRPLIWAAAAPRHLFSAPEPGQLQLLTYLNVRYLAIHPTRRIPAAIPRVELTGYPQDWIDTLDARPYLTRVYPAALAANDDGHHAGQFLVYRLDYDRIPRAWIIPPDAVGHGRGPKPPGAALKQSPATPAASAQPGAAGR